MTPRLNPDVNSYWMCDIGRFDYQWVESDKRLRRPMMRRGQPLEAAAWHDVEPRLRDRIQEAGSADPTSVRFLVSAHASIEELFVLRQVVEGLLGGEGMKAVDVSWTRSDKPQPAGRQVQDPGDRCTERQRRQGARLRGRRRQRRPARSVAAAHGRRERPREGAVRHRSGSGWFARRRLVDRRRAQERHAAAADRAGRGAVASSRRPPTSSCPARHTSRRTRSTRTRPDTCRPRRAPIAPPGDALDDWQILVNVGRVARADAAVRELERRAARHRRSRCRGRRTPTPTSWCSRRPVPARNWLQASNPSERWKWDFMYQDLPPVKGHNVQMESAAAQGAFIPLKPVE